MNVGEVMIVKPGTPQGLLFQTEPQWFNEMQGKARICHQSDYIAGIWRDFRLIKNDMEHACGWCRAQLFRRLSIVVHKFAVVANGLNGAF